MAETEHYVLFCQCHVLFRIGLIFPLYVCFSKTLLHKNNGPDGSEDFITETIPVLP